MIKGLLDKKTHFPKGEQSVLFLFFVSFLFFLPQKKKRNEN